MSKYLEVYKGYGISQGYWDYFEATDLNDCDAYFGNKAPIWCWDNFL